jgi:LysM repeat protein
MRRDVGSELLVALVAIGVLALALVFGLVLTLSQRADAALTQSAQTQAVQADGVTSVALSVTPADLPTVAAAFATETRRATDRLSSAPTHAATANIALTLTVTATHTPAQAPAIAHALTMTFTAAHTPTRAPTLTPTSTPMRTQLATHTLTLTRTRAPTLTATRTPTATASATPTLAPTSTATGARTLAPSATFTPSPTPTPTLFVPTVLPELLTPNPTPIGAAALAEPPCTPRRDWMPYTVQAGETLFSLARRAQISLAELARANCISDLSRLVVGTVIYVPRPLSTPTASALLGVNIRSCGDPLRRIVNIAPDSTLRGTFVIIGTAQHDDFQFYKIEIRAEGSDLWQNIITHSTPVDSGVLATFNTALLPSGLYWLRLTVVDKTGNFPPPCEVRVILAP